MQEGLNLEKKGIEGQQYSNCLQKRVNMEKRIQLFSIILQSRKINAGHKLQQNKQVTLRKIPVLQKWLVKYYNEQGQAMPPLEPQI